MADARAGGEQHHQRQQADLDGGREVGLDEEQQRERHHDGEHGQQAAAEAADLRPLLGAQHRRPDDDRELRQLGDLHRHSQLQPAAGAVDARRDGVREGEDEHQQHPTGDEDDRPGEGADALEVDAGGEQEEEAAGERPDELVEDERAADHPPLLDEDGRGGVDRREAEGDEDRGNDDEEARFPAEEPLALRHQSAPTSRLKVRPRSS